MASEILGHTTPGDVVISDYDINTPEEQRQAMSGALDELLPPLSEVTKPVLVMGKTIPDTAEPPPLPPPPRQESSEVSSQSTSAE